MGYCFGGTAVLELARVAAPMSPAVIGLHAGLPVNRPEDARNIKGKVLILSGAADPMVGPDMRQKFEAQMNEAGVDWRMYLYGGAVHAFTIPGVEAAWYARHGVSRAHRCALMGGCAGYSRRNDRRAQAFLTTSVRFARRLLLRCGVEIFLDPGDLAIRHGRDQQERCLDHAIGGLAHQGRLFDEAARVQMHTHILVLLVPELLHALVQDRLVARPVVALFLVEIVPDGRILGEMRDNARIIQCPAGGFPAARHRGDGLQAARSFRGDFQCLAMRLELRAIIGHMGETPC